MGGPNHCSSKAVCWLTPWRDQGKYTIRSFNIPCGGHSTNCSFAFWGTTWDWRTVGSLEMWRGERGVAAWRSRLRVLTVRAKGSLQGTMSQLGVKGVWWEWEILAFLFLEWVEGTLNPKWGHLVLGFASDERCGSYFPWPHWVLLLKVIKSAVCRIISSAKQVILFSVNYTNRTPLKSKDILFKMACLTR